MPAHRIATAVALAVGLVTAGGLAASPAMATLVDSSYIINGVFDRNQITLSGSFDVVGGLVQDVTVSPFFVNLGDPAIYQGPGVNEATGTSFSAQLLLTNPGPDTSGVGFLNLFADGTFECAGISNVFSDLCALTTLVFGQEPNEKMGTYSIEQVVTAVPLPASGLLLSFGIGALAAVRLAGARRSARRLPAAA